MERIRAPYLELGFFFINKTGVIEQLATSLAEMAASPPSRVAFATGGDIQTTAFASPVDLAVKDQTLAESQLPALLKASNHLITSIWFDKLPIYQQQAPGFITYNKTGVATLPDQHPLAIVTSGYPLFDHSTSNKPARRRKLGGQVYDFFVKMIHRVQPAYASITCEYPLKCPADLAHEPRDFGFQDFYLDRSFFQPPAIHKIEAVFTDVFKEHWTQGVYISSTPYLNPLNIGLSTTEAQVRSSAAARIIGHSLLATMRNQES